MAKARQRWLDEVPDAQVTVFGAAPVPGLGSAGGFKFMVEDRGGMGVRSLEDQMENLVDRFKRLAWVTLSEKSFAGLRDDQVPETTLAKLESLKDKPLLWRSFEATLSRTLDKDELAQSQKAILNRVDKAALSGRRQDPVPRPASRNFTWTLTGPRPRRWECPSMT